MNDPDALLASINNLAVPECVKFHHLLYYILESCQVTFDDPDFACHFTPTLRGRVANKLIGITGGSFHNFMNIVSRANNNTSAQGFGVLNEAILDVHVDLGANPDHGGTEIEWLEIYLGLVYILSDGIAAPDNPEA